MQNLLKHKRLIIVLLILICLGILAGLAAIALSCHVKSVTKSRIYKPESAEALKGDCILVLGAGVWHNNDPSPMLAERLDCAIALYFDGAAPKLLMSGDHGTSEYNEVAVMKQYAIDAGVPAEDIFMDHAGFSTYDSVYRARDVFAAKNLIIATQRYHQYRALYIADALGIEACGVEVDQCRHAGQTYREAREIAARAKDVLKCVVQPKPTFLGEVIPISGNGNATNDDAFEA